MVPFAFCFVLFINFVILALFAIIVNMHFVLADEICCIFLQYLLLAKGLFLPLCLLLFVKFVIRAIFAIIANAHWALADEILSKFAKKFC